jgi:hypothetical protein
MKKQVEKRFGAVAVEKGFITTKQLIEALAIQATENVREGKHRLIGEILSELGYMTPAQVDDVLVALSDSIIYMISSGR